MSRFASRRTLAPGHRALAEAGALLSERDSTAPQKSSAGSSSNSFNLIGLAEAVAAEAVAAEVAARFSEQSLMNTDALEVWLVLAVERSLHDAESMGHWGELLKV